MIVSPALDRHACATAADRIAYRLAKPPSWSAEQAWRDQALWKGLAGTALLHIERAHAGLGSWRTAHTWIKAVARNPVSAGDSTGLHAGVTAFSFVLHAADADSGGRYAMPRAVLDSQVVALAHRRIDQAGARIERGTLPAFREYDLLHGLTGIGAHLLRHAPRSEALPRILTYLVHMSRSVNVDGERLPGFWVTHGPDPAVEANAGGHLNFGIAHGITGPLALLAHALRRGISVDGQAQAIASICARLDAWRQDHDGCSWWPQWLTRTDLTGGRTAQQRPGRPSWCYGVAGVARAQQVAAIAVGDADRRLMAEAELAASLDDTDQLAQLTGLGLCHGLSGLYQTTWHAARDGSSAAISDRLPLLADRLVSQAVASHSADHTLLDGQAGLALALHTAATDTTPRSAWDACLLII